MESARKSLYKESENGKSYPSSNNSSNEILVVKIEDDIIMPHLSTYQPHHHNPIDFTADVTVDQLNDKKVIEHLIEVENISCNPDSYGSESQENDAAQSLLQSSQRCNEHNDKSYVETRDVILVEESIAENKKSQMHFENQWYDKLIMTKVNTVVGRLSKLARVLKHTYPCYKSCLEQIEAKIGMPVCKLDPPHRCPLSRANINRWKFFCTKKSVTESAGSKTEADMNVKNIWQLKLYDGSNTISNNSHRMIPNFVMRAVKMFEDFINSFDQVTHSKMKIIDEITDDDVVVLENDEKSSESTKLSGSKGKSDISPQWSGLLVRSNNKGELMMFATGKYITQSVMESLKELFECGLGKDCNVKSLYCKAMTKINDVQTSITTFLVGVEALDETVGKLKIQLAPKTNFWLSTAGAEELAKTVEEFLEPSDLGTVVDIGCGLGLIGLSIAHKCYQVFGIDSPSEVEEAEMTCELNQIKNAYFLMGEPAEMMSTIEKAVEWRRVIAVINTNTNIGRTVEVMIGLRKIKNLRRIVLVTTLTKQSVRPILELTRPADEILGDPFIALRAAVVDTLPTGPQFEVVILMERRPLSQMLNVVVSQVSMDLVIPNPLAKGANKFQKKNTIICHQKTLNNKLNLIKNTISLTNNKGVISNRKFLPCGVKSVIGSKSVQQNKNQEEIPIKKFVKNPFYEQSFKVTNVKKNTNQKKLSCLLKSQNNMNQHKMLSDSRLYDNANQQYSPTILRSPRKITSNSIFCMKNEVDDESIGSSYDVQKRKHKWDLGIGMSRNEFIPEKRLRENNDVSPRISAQVELDLLQKVKEQQHLLEVAKQKLTGGSSQVIDQYTALEVQDMLNLAIERTNQIESQIPRSLWDQIESPDHISPDVIMQKEIMFKERHVQEINQEDIVITTSNKEFKQTFDAAWTYSQCSSVPPLEPNLVMPRDIYTDVTSNINARKLQHQNNSVKQKEERWIPPLCTRRPLTPLTHSLSAASKKILSSAKSDFQLPQYQQQQQQQQQQEQKQAAPIPLQGIARPSRQFASSQRLLSPLYQKSSASSQELMHRHLSPLRRQVVSVGFGDDWNILSRDVSEQQTNWQYAIDHRQTNNSTNRCDIDTQKDKFHQGNDFNSNWSSNKSVDDSWINNNCGSGGSVDTWNRKRILTDKAANKQWHSQQQQIPAENRLGRSSGSDWNVWGREKVNTNNSIINRDEAWMNAYKRRWSEPQSNENSWDRSRDKEDWNDLPEDARDPWGDDNASCSLSQGNWNRNLVSNERSMANDNWRLTAPLAMNSKPQWHANMNCSNLNSNLNANKTNSSVNSKCWNGGEVRNDNMKKPRQIINWQQGNGNGNSNEWRQPNSFGGFQLS